MNVAYRHYLLGMLMAIFGTNFAERLALGLMLNDIKADLDLSDTQLGLMTGLAFAIFYAFLGIPIARWADRSDRVRIISLGAIVAGTSVALCGAAGNFVQLILIRIGVAAGEAAAIPPAHSLLADTFNRAERPRAAAIYKLGGSLSLIIGYVATGWINAAHGWRTTFIVLGIPSIALGVLAWATLKDPRRSPRRSSALPPRGERDEALLADQLLAKAKPPTLIETINTLAANASYVNLLLVFAVASFFNVGVGQWEPSFFARSYGLDSQALGLWFGLCVGVGGALGTVAGGELAARLAPRDEARQLRGIAICYLVLCAAFAAKYTVQNAPAAFALTFVTAFVGGLTIGPLFALIQTIVPARLRATSVAIIYLSGTLIGMGLGPLAAGTLSDAYARSAGDESLRLALLTLTPGYLWCAFQIWRATHSINGDIETATEGAPE